MNDGTPPSDVTVEQRATSPNILYKVALKLNALNPEFREMICEECNWSVPTYYRKMRGFMVGRKKHRINLSNAEIESVKRVFRLQCKKLFTYSNNKQFDEIL